MTECIKRGVTVPVTQTWNGRLDTTENDIDAREHQINLGAWQFPDARSQQRFVQRHHLRHVRDRVFGELGDARSQGNVSWRVGPPKIAGERNADNGRNAASVQGVALDDNHGSPETWTRPSRSRDVSPPDLALRNYHSVRSNTRRAAAPPNLSARSPALSQTRFIASVTSSGAWRATYSRSAALKTSLRDRRACLANRSARSKTSSGMDTAVFIPIV